MYEVKMKRGYLVAYITICNQEPAQFLQNATLRWPTRPSLGTLSSAMVGLLNSLNTKILIYFYSYFLNVLVRQSLGIFQMKIKPSVLSIL